MTINVNSYTVDELASWLENKPVGASFIDVREASELEEQGTIKGYDANIPYFLTNTNPELFEKEFSTLDKDEQLVISCRSGRRSLLAAQYTVSKLGFKNVYNVEGGILKWIQKGYPVEKLQ
ncbi:sulfurtransferase [Mucor ambiguus]|uniref:Sulfurtransferase n=1 Tax=Mucor ambiguus TaxID=91626 RepID=A0A0C9N6D3_9FUNG|nr:sulfurtransferase [Mucor ambiguus]